MSPYPWLVQISQIYPLCEGSWVSLQEPARPLSRCPPWTLSGLLGSLIPFSTLEPLAMQMAINVRKSVHAPVSLVIELLLHTMLLHCPAPLDHVFPRILCCCSLWICCWCPLSPLLKAQPSAHCSSHRSEHAAALPPQPYSSARLSCCSLPNCILVVHAPAAASPTLF